MSLPFDGTPELTDRHF